MLAVHSCAQWTDSAIQQGVYVQSNLAAPVRTHFCVNKLQLPGGIFETAAVYAGNRYSNEGVLVQAGRGWGFDTGSAIQPRIYAHPSTSELQLPESSSVRVLAGQPMLSDLFVPFRQPTQVTTLSTSHVWRTHETHVHTMYACLRMHWHYRAREQSLVIAVFSCQDLLGSPCCLTCLCPSGSLHR